MATSAARRAAKRSAGGERVLPRATTSRARKAAAFIGPIPEEDRDIIIDIKMHGWWDNDESLTDMRRHGTAQSVYNKAVSYANDGVPGNMINITMSDTPGLYNMYLDRESG
jgi:hypothetical protein